MVRRILAALALLLGLSASAGRAELILSVTDARIAPGGPAVVDVLISGDGALSLDIFSIVVRLSDADGRRLEFVAPGPGSLTDGQLDDPSYLFAGNSLFAGGTAGILSDEPNPSDTYIGGDGTISGLGVLVPTAPTLLTRLQLTALTADSPRIGDRFLVSVDLLDARTMFLDAAFDSLPARLAAAGTVTVVPEPTALALICSGLAPVVLIAAARARRST